MGNHVQCPHCQQKLQVQDQAWSPDFVCPLCKRRVGDPVEASPRSANRGPLPVDTPESIARQNQQSLIWMAVAMVIVALLGLGLLIFLLSLVVLL